MDVVYASIKEENHVISASAVSLYIYMINVDDINCVT